MTAIVRCAAAAALIGALGVAATPGDARTVRHPDRTAAAAYAAEPAAAPAPAAPVLVPVVGGGYYSNLTNPRWGYCPMFGYSNALFFSSGGPRCGDP